MCVIFLKKSFEFKVIFGIVTIILPIVIFNITLFFNKTVTYDEDSIIKEIKRRVNIEPEILEMIYDNGNIFVLFKDKQGDKEMFTSYTQNKYLNNRYNQALSLIGYSNSESNERQFDYNSTTYVYNENRYLIYKGLNSYNAEYLELTLENTIEKRIIKKNISSQKYIMAVVICNDDVLDAKIEFFDKNKKSLGSKKL